MEMRDKERQTESERDLKPLEIFDSGARSALERVGRLGGCVEHVGNVRHQQRQIRCLHRLHV